VTQLAEEQVKDILAPHHSALLRIILNAWEDRKKCPDMAFKRTIANAMWDYMIKHARIEFDDTPGIHVIDRPNTCLLHFDSGIVLRFKKGDDNNLSRNYPTNFALDFNDPQINLPSVPHATRVEVLYIPDREGVEIESIRVVKRNRDQPEWWYVIDTEAAANVHELPARGNATDNRQQTRTRVAVKKTAQKKESSPTSSSG